MAQATKHFKNFDERFHPWLPEAPNTVLQTGDIRLALSTSLARPALNQERPGYRLVSTRDDTVPIDRFLSHRLSESL